MQIEIKTIPLILYMRTGQTSCGRSGRPRLVLHVYAIPGEAQSRHVPDIRSTIRPVRTALASLGRNAAPRRIRNFKNFVARQKLMVDIHLRLLCRPITPVQCIEHRYGRRHPSSGRKTATVPSPFRPATRHAGKPPTHTTVSTSVAPMSPGHTGRAHSHNTRTYAHHRKSRASFMSLTFPITLGNSAPANFAKAKPPCRQWPHGDGAGAGKQPLRVLRERNHPSTSPAALPNDRYPPGDNPAPRSC